MCVCVRLYSLDPVWLGVFAYLTLKPISPHINGAFLVLGQTEAARLCLCNMKQAGKTAALLIPTEDFPHSLKKTL